MKGVHNMVYRILGLFVLAGLLNCNDSLNASDFSEVEGDQRVPSKSVTSVEKVASPVKEGKDNRVCLPLKDAHEAAKPLNKEGLPTVKSKASPRKPHDESRQAMVKSSEKIMQELLSKKFKYFGDNLSGEIQKIREGKSFQELTSIKEYLVEPPQVRSLKKKKKVRNEVTIFVKKEDDDRDDAEGFKRSLLGAAYFPEELDPRTKSTPLVSLARFKFIHRQLADALFYEYPLASQYLKQVMSICNAPLEENSSYKNSYHIPDIDPGNYKQYLFQFPLPFEEQDDAAAEVQDTQEEDINQEIDFPSYSKEMGDYFQQLLAQEQSPEKRNKKRKR